MNLGSEWGRIQRHPHDHGNVKNEDDRDDANDDEDHTTVAEPPPLACQGLGSGRTETTASIKIIKVANSARSRDV